MNRLINIINIFLLALPVIAKDNNKNAGIIVQLVGKAQRITVIDQFQKTTTEPLENNSYIYPGDIILTSKSTYLKILMKDKTILSVDSNTKVSIKEFEFKEKSKRKSLYHLSKGRLRLFYTAKAKNTDDLKISTPTTVFSTKEAQILTNVYHFNDQFLSDIALLSGNMTIHYSKNKNVKKNHFLKEGNAYNSYIFKKKNSVEQLNKQNLLLLKRNNTSFLPRIINKSGKHVNINSKVRHHFQIFSQGKVKVASSEKGILNNSLKLDIDPNSRKSERTQVRLDLRSKGPIHSETNWRFRNERTRRRRRRLNILNNTPK